MENPSESRLRVAIRIRPTNVQTGADAPTPPHIACTSTSVTVVAMNTHYAQQQQAITLGDERDRVFAFGPGHSNDSVASGLDIPAIVHDCVRGKRDGLVCCYGQSCSGKSYTMFGPKGMVQQGLQAALALAAGCGSASGRIRIQVSASELYMNTLRPLMDSRHGQWMPVTKAEDITTVHEMVATARTVSSTSLNAESSRSHAFVIVRFERGTDAGELGGGGSVSTRPPRTTGTTLVFVDLAGSERVSKSQAAGIRLQEGIEINKSLSALGNVMRALAGASQTTPPGASPTTIPWRASKLTQLLKAYVRCGSTIWFVLCISGEEEHAHESLSTLRFGSAVLGVTLHAHRTWEAEDGGKRAAARTAVSSPAIGTKGTKGIEDNVSVRHWVLIYLCWACLMIVLGC